jgi:hypothetical protein
MKQAVVVVAVVVVGVVERRWKCPCKKKLPVGGVV